MKKFNIIVAVLVALALLFIVLMTVKSLVSGENPDVSNTPPASFEVPSDTPTPTLDYPEQPIDSAPPTLPPVVGESFTVTAPFAKETLTLTIDTSLYTREEQENGDLFYATEDQSREVFIEVAFVLGDLDQKIGGFLDNYLPDATNTEFGEELVASSSVAARSIRAESSSRAVDGWLIKVEGGFFAVVAGYKTNEQGEFIYRMLNTLVFEQ